MRELYKISDIAKTFAISRRTLIYYDEINLFKPCHVDLNTAYRYYSNEQIYTLRLVIDLKKSGFTLNDIKKFIELNEIEKSKDYFQEKIEYMKNQIAHLQNSIKIIEKRYSQLEELQTSSGLLPELVENVDFSGIYIKVDSPYLPLQEERAHKKLIQLTKKLKLQNPKSVVVIEKTNVLVNDVIPIRYVGYLIPHEVSSVDVKNIKYKKCVKITHKLNFEQLGESYNKIMKFINEFGYTISDNAYEVSEKEIVQIKDGVGGVIDIYIPIE